MKKKLMTALSLVCALVCAFTFTACDKGENSGGGNQHSHIWNITGTDNGNGTHRILCTGEGECDEGGYKDEAHNTSGADGACSVCGYKADAQGGGGGGGNEVANQELLDAIDATLAAEKYKLSVTAKADVTLSYEDEIITENTDLGGGMTGAQLIAMLLEGLTGDTTFANPFTMDGGVVNYYVDYAGGKVKAEMSEPYSDSVDYEYYELDGATINKYYMAGPDASKHSEKVSSVGHASAAAAKAALINHISFVELQGNSLETMVSTKVKGIGAYSYKQGTLRELSDLFSYDEASKTYSATVDASVSVGPDYSECSVAITVDGGKVTKLAMAVSGNSMLEEMFRGLPDGVTFDAKMVNTVAYSDFGSVSVDIPAEYKTVTDENTIVLPVITASDWEEMLADYATSKFALEYVSVSKGTDPTTDEPYEYKYDEQILVDFTNKTAIYRSQRRDLPNDYHPTDYYTVDDGKVSAWGWKSVGDGYNEDPYTTDIEAGQDEKDALVWTIGRANLTNYAAGFEKGKLEDMYADFNYDDDIFRYNSKGSINGGTVYYDTTISLAANLKLGDREVKAIVRFWYNAEEEEFSVSSIEIEYLGGDSFYNDFTVRALRSNEEEYLYMYHPDRYQGGNND